MIPQPSDDPNDPLNWPVWQKNAAFYSVIFFSALANWVISGLGVGIVQVSIEFNKDIGDVVQNTISWCVLTLGIGVSLTRLMQVSLIEFLLGSFSSVLRKAPHFCDCHHRIVCMHYLERKNGGI